MGILIPFFAADITHAAMEMMYVDTLENSHFVGKGSRTRRLDDIEINGKINGERGKSFKKHMKIHYQILQLEEDKTWITADFGDLKMCKENLILTRQI